jgi:hypothetical protein
VGAVVTIQGQNFSTTLASNAVSFNGAAATVLSATANTLTATVPVGATTGPISVTVAGTTTNSSASFTFIPSPAILSVSPQFLVSSASATSLPNFQVTGTNLSGATFSFIPAFIPAPIMIVPTSISSDGTSAVLNLTIAPGTLGSFSLVATGASTASSQIPTSANTLQIVTPDGDADGDGLTNVVEVAINTNPLNAYTSGDGLPDGWQVFYGLNPMDKTVAGRNDGTGSTILQDYKTGLSPINLNRVPPAVSQVTPKNGATGVFVNDAVVVRFSIPLLTGTTLNVAQSAITAALGSNTTVPASSQLIAGQTLQAYMTRTGCGNSVIAGTVSLSGPAGQVAGTVTPSADGLSATFAPTLPLQSNTQYSVKVVGVRDAAGNLMTAPFVSSFTTGSSQDATLPQIATTSPVNGASNVPANTTVVVTFSKAIDPASVTAASFTITDTTANLAVAGAIQVDATNTMATFVPSQPLTVGDFFAVTLTTSIKDQAGNALPGNASFGFTTGEIAEEMDSVTFSLLNGSPPPNSAGSMEADSLTFSVLNGSPSSNSSGVLEADSLTFSVLNGTSPVSTGTIQAEVDSLTFSVLNGISPVQTTSTQAEADSLTFSLLNNSGPVPPATSPAEADSLTFSLLNGEAPAVGATVYEADSPTFSVWNQVTTGASAGPGQPAATPENPSMLAANASGNGAPSLGSDELTSTAGPGKTQQAGAGAGQLSFHGARALSANGDAVSLQETTHPSTLTTVLNRLFHRRSQRKQNAPPSSQAAIAGPSAKAHRSSKPKSNSASTGSGEVAASPGQL